MDMKGRGTIALTGRVEPSDIENVPSHTTLDFGAVESVGFAALRAILAKQKDGHDFDVVNANTDVYLMFDSTGANRFIHVSRKPREIDLSGFHIAGDGNMGDCYFDDQGDCMVKLYSDPRTLAMARREKIGAYTAFLSGIPTPLVGEEITSAGRHGVIFERARNKRSLSRIIADEPERLEECARLLADMALELHSTPCAKGLVGSTSDRMMGYVKASTFLTKQQMDKAVGIIENAPMVDTCLHGDLHLGNVIVSDNGPQFIDMSAFSFGAPGFDLGWSYVICSLCPDQGAFGAKRSEGMFHIDASTMHQFWRLFERFYFGAETDEQVAEVEHDLVPYALVKVVAVCKALDPDHPLFRPIFDRLLTRLGV